MLNQKGAGGRREGELARYEEIALMLAADIARGRYREGERIYGRSVLAGQYSVSPETIRKAVALLQAREVVETVAGSGIIVLSRRAAQKFVEDFEEFSALEKMEKRLDELLEQRNRLNAEIEHLTREIVHYKEALLKQMLYNTEEIKVGSGSPLVGQSVQSANIRALTGVTVTAVRRRGVLFDSPGEEVTLQPGDVLLVVGDKGGKEKLRGLAAGAAEEAGEI
ncbi:MAG: TrkA C-terminal domain-containing protein [Clostridia bacterium]|nr:GntR family transcriptional regulator [Clostridia bacterium]MDH7573621.1 TrkA C-terminal domain-containing protein [Clostridia bacterium]